MRFQGNRHFIATSGAYPNLKYVHSINVRSQELSYNLRRVNARAIPPPIRSCPNARVKGGNMCRRRKAAGEQMRDGKGKWVVRANCYANSSPWYQHFGLQPITANCRQPYGSGTLGAREIQYLYGKKLKNTS